jgi:hypothetical protein
VKRITPFKGKLWTPEEVSLVQPPRIIELEGHPFHLTQRCLKYPDVVHQYRQMVRRKSHHLFVHPDGSYTIDHYDHFNPDMGLSTRHIIYDLVPYKLGRE